MNVYEQIINTFIISVPEEFFITILILILLGRYDYLDKENWKQNIVKILLISVIPMAGFLNVCQYTYMTLNVTWVGSLKDVLGIIIMAIAIKILCKDIKISKVLGMTLIAFVIFAVIQISLLSIIVYGLRTGISYFNQSPFLNFIITIPERLVQYGIIGFVIIKKNSLSPNVNLLKHMLKNKILKRILFVSSMVYLTMLIWIGKNFFVSGMLLPLDETAQVFIIIITLITVVGVPIAIWLITISIYQQEDYLRKKILGGETDEE